MKQTLQLFAVALIAGATTLTGSHFMKDEKVAFDTTRSQTASFIPTSYTGFNTVNTVDFTAAAEKTVNAVVHVKNTTIVTRPTNVFEFFNGVGRPQEQVGSGSGVIISPDGYIITNNHVIDNATSLTITLNNNKTYEAELIGTDPKTDIALIKIMANEEFPYVPFGDSNNAKIGEWVLAVGNPFNLTSTVTAGIVSAKARDLDEFDGNPQSFIQTDAAVNRGNSGGALVNTRGELIGINTAIIGSETGSFVGYSFAVPSNIARKVIEDIMEYGDVQRGILGISVLNTKIAQQQGIDIAEGVYVADIEKGSGADQSGIKKGDIIKQIDGFKIAKFSDLAGYIGAKRPNDIVEVTIARDGESKIIPVTLIKLETYEITTIGIEVKNASKNALKAKGVKAGVEISRALTREVARFDIEGNIITEIDDIPVKNVTDVENVMKTRRTEDPLKVTFINKEGETHNYIFR